MKLQMRLALTVAAAAAVAIFLMAVASFLLAAREQRAAIDRSLLDVVSEPRQLASEFRNPDGRGRNQGRLGDIFETEGDGDQRLVTRVQVVGPTGRVIVDDGLPIVETPNRPVLETVIVDGERYRMVSASVGQAGRESLLQVARNLEDLEDGLTQLRRQIAAGSLLGIALAGLLGALVAQRLVRPISDVADAARELAVRQDLPSRIEVTRNDEIGDLASSFNQMVGALEVSRDQQRRLVADASHELRTPLTSLRIKIDLLDANPELDPTQREKLLSGAATELSQLTDLVTELVDLATDPTGVDEPVVELDLRIIAEETAERVRRTTGRTVTVVGPAETLVHGRDRMIRRAVSNLVDNAIKYSDGEVTLTVDGTSIGVRDRGDGIPPEDLDLVFDRFYRSPTARTRPGNGIGLAIVKRVAELHDGEVWARNHPDGGAVVGFELQTS